MAKGLVNVDIGGLVDKVGGIVDSLHTSGQEKAEAKLALAQLGQAAQMAQIEVAKTEAEHGSWFVAGGRPAIIWSGALTILYAGLIYPILNFVLHLNGLPEAPPPDTALVLSVVAPALGIGTLRTYEKTQGVARSRIVGRPAPGLGQ